ncbi:MAG: hypothetical protein MI700_05765 [Balneolales bacterium]|nr:hypothetical protein [Balneolales bacterium]
MNRVYSIVLLTCLVGGAVSAQTSIPSNYKGDVDWISRGILNGNLIETNYRNHGELARFGDNPHGVWPRSIGGRHIDGIGLFIAGRVTAERVKWPQYFPGATTDTTLTVVAINYRNNGRSSPTGTNWGLLPLNGFLNRNRIDPVSLRFERVPANSNDRFSWPEFWPDKLSNPDDPGWPGAWNGRFGRNVFSTDLETFYVMDDLSNKGYQIDPETNGPNDPFGIYYADPADSTIGGLGIQIETRFLQWANILAEDVMFMLYRITNIGGTDHDSLYFAKGIDYGLGTDENDDNASFDPQIDVAYGWDSDGVGFRSAGGTYDLGYTGFAFLESPADPFDMLDNDEDGIIDERRDSGPGILIEGQDNIRAYVEANYDLTNFERVYGPIEGLKAYQAGYWWTGDENLSWASFNDDDDDGIVDVGEFLNDDTGIDGLGPNDLGYTGPDFGEADGIPQEGERDFDGLDIFESDQIGLRGFDLGIRSNYEGVVMEEDFLIWQQIASSEFELGTLPPEEELNNNEPFLLFHSGPVTLPPEISDFFSLAWIFGEDEDDFFKNRITAQNIYDANYTFAQPPFPPTLTAIAGDGKVTLGWDTVSVNSFDRFTQEFDFEGYRLYKGTDNLLSDARTITDVDGTPTFYEPLAQWDLVNGIDGPVAVLENTSSYDLGNDTGLQFFYVDEDVINGVTYYYALSAYDRGVRDSTGTLEIDPQENVFNFGVDQFFNLVSTSPNAEVVTPRSNVAGFIDAGTNDDLSRVTSGEGTGSMSIEIVAEQEVKFGDTYQVTFFDSLDTRESPRFYQTSAFSLINVTESDTIFSRREFETTTPVLDGFILGFENEEEIALSQSLSGWVGNYQTDNEQISSDPRQLDGYETNWISSVTVESIPDRELTPDDFELRFFDEDVYFPPRNSLGVRDSLPFIAYNLTTETAADIIIIDNDDSEDFSLGDDLIITERFGIFRNRYKVTFNLPNSATGSIAPKEGDILRIANSKPFREGDVFIFTLTGSRIDNELARSELDDIYVVPNPYLAYSLYEPTLSRELEGRGDRRVRFKNLPQQCTIRIFNVRGELIRELEHSSTDGNGELEWDLRTKDGLDLAYGMYVFHVEAPGLGEKIGKIGIVK